jgi:hypothetical protein
MAKIQHADLPDQYLHEPKGASTALIDTVYVADGNGSGSFKLVPISSLDYTPEDVADITITSIQDPLSVSGAGLLSVADGTMNDVAYTTEVPVATVQTINKNFKELYDIYSRDVDIHNAVKADVEALATKLNQLIDGLANIGFVNNE